ncbi:hypothetical protein ACFQ8O_28850 [Streptomyces coelicoflavus]|uniref:hypothetical protein n=1 Tax=Streptomyces coelicoflavus TaxID=285562 RepID=UPI0036CCE005
MQRFNRWWFRAALGAVLLAVIPLTAPSTASAEAARATPHPALTAPPSATPAAGPERATMAANGRPASGKTPSAGPMFEQSSGVWQVNRTTVTLQNTVTDPDKDQANLTFDVWTVGADGKPGSHIDLDESQFGVLVSPMVDSGSLAKVTVEYGRLKPNTSYFFRTSAYEGALYETEWSPWAKFQIRGHAVDIKLPEPDKDAPSVDLETYQKPQVARRNLPESSNSLKRDALPAPLGEGCTTTAPDRISCLTVGKPGELTQSQQQAVQEKLAKASAGDFFSWCDNLNTGKDYITRTEACLKRATPLYTRHYSKLPNGQTILVGEAMFASEIQVQLDPKSTSFKQRWWMVPVYFKDFQGKQSEWGPLTISPDFTCSPQCSTSAPQWSAPPTWSTIGTDMHSTYATFTHTATGLSTSDQYSIQLDWDWRASTPGTIKQWEGHLGTSVPDVNIRCDKAIKNIKPGCVFSAYKPTWVMNFKKFPAAVAHAWLVQAKLANHPGSESADKPLLFLPSRGDSKGRTPKQNREVICPTIKEDGTSKGWAVVHGNPDTTLLTKISASDKRSCDEFAYASTYNSAGMPADNDGLNPVTSGDACVQTYATRVKQGEWHFYDDMRQAAPTWKEVCGRSSMSNWTNTQSMRPFPSTFSQPNRLLDKDPYWMTFPEFSGCSAGAATVKCTPKP